MSQPILAQGVVEIARSIQGLADTLWSDTRVTPDFEFGVDLFRRDTPVITTWIVITKNETPPFLARFKTVESLIGGGWDLYDLPRNILIDKALPAIVFEVFRRSKEDNILDFSKALNLYSWKIGLH